MKSTDFLRKSVNPTYKQSPQVAPSAFCANNEVGRLKLGASRDTEIHNFFLLPPKIPCLAEWELSLRCCYLQVFKVSGTPLGFPFPSENLAYILLFSQLFQSQKPLNT